MARFGDTYEAVKTGTISYTVIIEWGYELNQEGVPIFDQVTSKTFTFTIYSLPTYVLHVQSQPIDGIRIGYSGDYGGVGVTSFDVGPKEAPFTVTLNAPLVHEDYEFSYWLLDGGNMIESVSLTIKIDDEKRERTAIAVYSKHVIKYTLHVKSEPISGISISYSGDCSGTGTTDFNIGPEDSPFFVKLTAPSTFQNYKFIYWYIPELKLISVENPYKCAELKMYTSFNELTVVAVFSKDTSVINLKTVPLKYTGVITLAERGFEEYACMQELKFSVNQELSNLIVDFSIFRWDWHPEGPLSTPKEYPNIAFNTRISNPKGKEYSVKMNTSRGFDRIWIPIPEPVLGSWTMKITAFTEDSLSTQCKYYLSIYEDKSSIVKPLKVINLNTGQAEEKFGCSIWIKAYSAKEVVYPLMPSTNTFFDYEIFVTLHSDLGLEKNFPNIIAVGYDDVLGKRAEKYYQWLSVDRGEAEGYEPADDMTDPNLKFASKWSFKLLTFIPVIGKLLSLGKDIIEIFHEFHDLHVQDIYKPIVREAYQLYSSSMDENQLDILEYDIPAILEKWRPPDSTKRIWAHANLSLAPTSDFKIYISLGLKDDAGLHYYHIGPQVLEFKILGTLIKLSETDHKLYLHLLDSTGRHVGFDADKRTVVKEIEGSLYIDFMNGTQMIVIPPECKNFQILVDASQAEQQHENYNLTIVHVKRDGLRIEKDFQGTISKNEVQKIKVSISDSMIKIEKVTEEIPWLVRNQLWIIAGVVATVAILTVSIVITKKARTTKYSPLHNKKTKTKYSVL